MTVRHMGNTLIGISAIEKVPDRALPELVYDGQAGKRSRSLVVVSIMRCRLNGDDRGRMQVVA
jgi:hypothetical protein